MWCPSIISIWVPYYRKGTNKPQRDCLIYLLMQVSGVRLLAPKHQYCMANTVYFSCFVGKPMKTFAYLDVDITDSGLQKCELNIDPR